MLLPEFKPAGSERLSLQALHLELHLRVELHLRLELQLRLELHLHLELHLEHCL